MGVAAPLESIEQGNTSTKVDNLGSKLSLKTMEEATTAMTTFRLRLEQAIILAAGEEMSARELRALAAEQMRTFLDEVGLGQVIGLERWARETADEISRLSAEEFRVQVTTSEKR